LNTRFYVDILHITQPEHTIIKNTDVIWLAIDNDEDLSNGLLEEGEVNEIAPSNNSIQPLTIHTFIIDNDIIRSTFSYSLDIDFPPGVMTLGRKIYLDGTVNFSEFNIRGKEGSC